MSALYFHISINALRHSREGWGDLAYANALADALASKGHRAALFYREERPELTGQGDIVLRIIGPHLEDPVEGVPNFLWMISPPNLAPPRTLGRYQRLFLASQLMCDQLAEAGLPTDLLPPIEFLPQASDTSLFHPNKRPADAAELPLVFVGNHAPRAPRTNVLQAIQLGHELAIWGQGWDGHIPPQMLRGARVSAPELAAIYASAQVVMNSHMPQMAAQGYMSNRSFDALACGATVVSDAVAGFHDPSLPGLQQASSPESLDRALRLALASAPDAATRQARHAAIREAYSFAARAESFIAAAQSALAMGQAAPFAYQAAPPPAPRASPGRTSAKPRLDASIAAAESEAAPGDIAPGSLCDLAEQHDLHLTLRCTDPTSSADGDARAEMIRAARTVQRLCAVLALRDRLGSLTLRAGPELRQGQIHAMQADLRAAQILLTAPRTEIDAQAPVLAARARRLIEASEGLGAASVPTLSARSLIRVLRGVPLHEHIPPDLNRDRQKRHLRLWPRQQSSAPKRPIGVFLHLYYDALAPQLRQALTRLEAAHKIYISTDTAAKAAHIASTFPSAEIRILPNRGRDIWAKLYGFLDVYDRHDLVLHLHGKKSSHAQRLDGWLEHILNCLLPEPALLNRLLSLFDSVPKLGIAAPLAFRPVLAAAHWGDNLGLARELAQRMQLPQPLPGNDRLDFPAGSMFWARTAALRPLLDLRLSPDAFPPEASQIDGTAAHAIERLFGPVCQQQGFELIPVAPPDNSDWPSYRLTLDRNGALRDLLRASRFQDLPL